MQRLIGILILLLLASPVCAAEYYVDNGSTDCSTPSDTDYDQATRTCGAGSSTVYNTIEGLNAVVGEGDTVYIKPGTYTPSGTYLIDTAVANLNYEGSGDATAIILNGKSKFDQDGTSISGVSIQCADTTAPAACLLISSDNNEVSDCYFTGKKPDTYMLALATTADYNVIDGNYFSHNASAITVGTHTGDNNAATLTDSTKNWTPDSLIGMIVVNDTDKYTFCTITDNDATTVTCTLGGGDSGYERDWDTGDKYRISTGVGSVPIHLKGTYNTISNNTFRYMNEIHACILVWGTNQTISGNEMHNIGGGQGTIHVDIIQTWGTDGADVGNTILFEKNYAHDIDGQLWNISFDENANFHHWTIRNNVFYNFTLTGNTGIPYVYLLNNTFVKFAWNTGHIRFMCAANWDSSNAIVKNNAFIGGGSTDGNNENNGWFAFEDEENCADNAASNNYVSKMYDYSTPYQAKTGWNTDSGNVNGGDPKFTTYGSDWTIGSDSPLKDAGADLSAIWSSATDKAGVARPQGAAWDIGAYEYDAGEVAGSATIGSGGTITFGAGGTITLGN